MGQSRNPGPQGIGFDSGVDDGTLVLARSPTQAVNLDVHPDGKQGLSKSWPVRRADAYGRKNPLLVAEIYFPTNGHALDGQDKQALETLTDSLKTLMKDGFKATLTCTGGADHRWKTKYNRKLGGRRAVAVGQHILQHVSGNDLTIVMTSTGEAHATQPVGRSKVPSKTMMADRRVSVILEPDALEPPVKISVTGNWILNSSIEKREIDNQGKVVAHPGSSGARASEAESDYMGWVYDPLRPVATVETRYSLVTVNGNQEATVHCDVVYNKTGQVLFRAAARTDFSKPIPQHLQYHPDRPGVKRVIDLGESNPFPGYVVEQSNVTGVHMRALHLFETIYSQLQGRHKNITRRVSEELRLQAVGNQGSQAL